MASDHDGSASPRARDGARVATLLVLVAALLWSTGGLGVKSVDKAVPALSLAGYRSLFAAPILFAGAFVESRRVGLRLLPSLGRPAVWAAAVAYAAMVVCFVASAKLTTAANAILLQYTCPIYVALLSWPLLRERIQSIDVFATIGVVVGMIVFFLDKVSAEGRLGNIVAIVSSFGAAGVPLFLRLEQRLQTRLDPAWKGAAASPYVAMGLGNLLAVGACAHTMVESPIHDGMSWAIVVALGSIQIGTAYWIYGRAVGKLPALRTTLLTTIEPIVSPLWVLLGNGERPSTYAIVGGLVILISVTAHAVLRGAKRKEVSYSPDDR